MSKPNVRRDGASLGTDKAITKRAASRSPRQRDLIDEWSPKENVLRQNVQTERSEGDE